MRTCADCLVCAEANCGWRLHPDLFEDELRPDLCGAVVILHTQVWRDVPVDTIAPINDEVPVDTAIRLRQYSREFNRFHIMKRRVNDTVINDYYGNQQFAADSEKLIAGGPFDVRI